LTLALYIVSGFPLYARPPNRYHKAGDLLSFILSFPAVFSKIIRRDKADSVL